MVVIYFQYLQLNRSFILCLDLSATQRANLCCVSADMWLKLYLCKPDEGRERFKESLSVFPYFSDHRRTAECHRPPVTFASAPRYVCFSLLKHILAG